MVAHLLRAMERCLTAGLTYLPSPWSTDASGSWGCGATDGHDWFQCAWHDNWQSVNIATKELVPIILAVGTWGYKWHVLFRSDNMTVVEILKVKNQQGQSNHAPAQVLAFPVCLA